MIDSKSIITDAVGKAWAIRVSSAEEMNNLFIDKMEREAELEVFAGSKIGKIALHIYRLVRRMKSWMNR